MGYSNGPGVAAAVVGAFSSRRDRDPTEAGKTCDVMAQTILRRKPRPGHSAAYCARLDTLPFRAETLDLGAESQFAFRLNAAVFEQLGYGFPVGPGGRHVAPTTMVQASHRSSSRAPSSVCSVIVAITS